MDCVVPILFWASQRRQASFFFAEDDDSELELDLLTASAFLVSADAAALLLSLFDLLPPSVEDGLFSLLAESDLLSLVGAGDLLSLVGAADLLSSVADSALRLSFIYHPDPLKIIPAEEKSFRTAF